MLTDAHPDAALAPVAAAVDAGVFGPGAPTEDAAAAVWKDVDVALASLHTGLGRWRRFRAFVSLRSFRRGPSWVSRLPLPFRKAKS